MSPHSPDATGSVSVSHRSARLPQRKVRTPRGLALSRVSALPLLTCSFPAQALTSSATTVRASPTRLVLSG